MLHNEDTSGVVNPFPCIKVARVGTSTVESDRAGVDDGDRRRSEDSMVIFLCTSIILGPAASSALKRNARSFQMLGEFVITTYLLRQ